jgi:hypothetical protein
MVTPALADLYLRLQKRELEADLRRRQLVKTAHDAPTPDVAHTATAADHVRHTAPVRAAGR